jgi:hypothetical protein
MTVEVTVEVVAAARRAGGEAHRARRWQLLRHALVGLAVSNAAIILSPPPYAEPIVQPDPMRSIIRMIDRLGSPELPGGEARGAGLVGFGPTVNQYTAGGRGGGGGQ